MIGVAPPGELAGDREAYRFTETQIVSIMNEAETGKKAREIRRQHGIQ